MVDRFLGREKREKDWRDELLSAYIDDQLSTEERARLEQRLATDPALRADLHAMRKTVALLNDLPQVPVPRNFILPQSMARRPQSAPQSAPQSVLPARPKRAWAVPLLTAATTLVTLAFGVVLSLDLLFVGSSQFALAPTSEPVPVAERMEAEPTSLANDTAQNGDQAIGAVEVTHDVEAGVEAVPTGTSAPMMLAVPSEEAEEMAEYGATPPPTSDGTATEPPAGGGGRGAGTPGEPTPTVAALAEAAIITPTEEPPPPPSTPLPEPTGAPLPKASGTVQAEETKPATPDTAPEWEELPAPPVLETAEPEIREAPVSGIRPAMDWLALEIVLGVTALGLLLATIWAWRARR